MVYGEKKPVGVKQMPIANDRGKISVIIPMYNSEDTIINALNSIKHQTAYEQILEIIVVNDGSTDNSLNVVKKYIEDNKNMPIIIIDKSNGGVSSARNAGMKVARGEWIALLDSDDEWFSEKIEIQMKIIKEYPEIDFLGGDFDKKGLKILWKKVRSLYKANVYDLFLKNFPQPSTVIFKKKIFECLGGFDETQRFAEDANYFIKICKRYNFYYLPKLLIVYDRGKRGFGVRGLSANLSQMYKGNVKNIKEFRKEGVINTNFYIFLRLFYWVKYLRRIIIVNVLNKVSVCNRFK